MSELSSKALLRLQRCAGLPEHLPKSSKISCTGLIVVTPHFVDINTFRFL